MSMLPAQGWIAAINGWVCPLASAWSPSFGIPTASRRFLAAAAWMNCRSAFWYEKTFARMTGRAAIWLAAVAGGTGCDMNRLLKFMPIVVAAVASAMGHAPW